MRRFCMLLIAVGMFLWKPQASHADTLFAILTPKPFPIGPTTPYRFDNATQTFLTSPDPVEVMFQFLVPVPIVGTKSIPALLSIRAVASSPILGTNQALEGLEFTIVPRNAEDVFGAGILLRSSIPNPVDFPAGTLADLFSVGNLGFLGSEFGIGLIMQSSYLTIDPTQNQTAAWMFSIAQPSGGFAPGANGFLRDTRLNGLASFTASFEIPLYPISGQVLFEDIVPDAAAQEVTFEFRPRNGEPAFTRLVSVSADGTFAPIEDVVAGQYDVAIKGPRNLRKTVEVNTLSGPVSDLTALLKAGDANNDNSVDVLDLDRLIQTFDKCQGDAGYNAGADFNGDNCADVLDLDLLIRNFDLLGDE
jgi:hypothetical protein